MQTKTFNFVTAIYVVTPPWTPIILLHQKQKSSKKEKKNRKKKRKVQEQSGLAKRMKGSRRGEEGHEGPGGEGGSGVELSAEVVSGVAGGRRRSSSSHLKGRCVYFLFLTNSFMSSKLWQWRGPELLCLCCGGRRGSLALPLPSLWRAAMRNTLERGLGRQAEGGIKERGSEWHHW